MQKQEDTEQSLNALLHHLERPLHLDSSVGQTPKKSIYRENKLRLYRYEPHDVPQKKTPLLFIYALVNRPFIIDLENERSLIQAFLKKGYPVYLIDWGYPDNTDRKNSLNDYINGFIHRCVQQVKRDALVKKIDVFSICQGATLSLCYSALHPQQFRKHVCCVAPIDFHASNDHFVHLTKGLNAQTSACTNVQNQHLVALFKSLKPFLTQREKYAQVLDFAQDKKKLETFIRMERWLTDGPDLAALAASEFLLLFYQQNALHLNALEIEQNAVRLNKIRSKVLNVYALKDHIVPPESSTALSGHIKPSLYEEFAVDSGHIGAFTSQKTQQNVVDKITRWLG